MISTSGITDTFLFEWRQLMKFPRVVWWIALAGFPPLIIGLILSDSNDSSIPDSELLALIGVSSVLTAVTCVLGLLLVATPVVYAELEGKTWSYLAVRPDGKSSVLLGKYLAAATWSTTTGWLALLLCFLLLGSPEGTPFRGYIFLLVPLLNISIGAAMVFLGVLCLRKAMVFGVLYALFFEAMIGWIPAVVSHLTVNYHLRTLWFKAADMPRTPELDLIVGQRDASLYVASIILYTAIFLAGALYVLSQRQLVTQQED